jgi:hypothetical protein
MLRQTVSRPVCLGVKHSFETSDHTFCLTVAGLLMWGALFNERTSLSFTLYLLTTTKLISVITYRHGPRMKTPFTVVLLRFCGNVCLRRCYSVTVAYTCLLRTCCLAANVSRSTRYNIVCNISDRHKTSVNPTQPVFL